MRFLFFVATIFLACQINGQTCNCESNFEWVKKTFEENDAGFQYVIDKKGQAAYNIHNQLMLEKIKEAETLTECTGLLYEWLTFFRSEHLGIERLTYEASVSLKYETYEVDIPQFEKYISTKQEADYEGIWKSGSSTIGIKKEGINYIGFFIEAEANAWRIPVQIVLKIDQYDNDVKSTTYMQDHSSIESGEPQLIGSNHLKIGPYIWNRLSPVFVDDPLFENYFKAIDSENPYLEKLNANTLYLRIPSFEFKSAIDKLITENNDKILKTDNLIIDLRDNGGGDDRSFQKLLPILYTNPITSVGVEILSTELNNKLFLDYTKEANFIVRFVYKRIYKKMQKRLGEFVLLGDKEVDTYQQKVVYEYPKNIGIIIDRGCASSTEEFLLAAKQSEKVKMFGAPTLGCLDISNVVSVESPCKEFNLLYSISKSLRIPENAVDDTGILPDIYIDETIPQHKWVEFVNENLHQ